MGYVQEARENHVKKKVEEALRSKMKQKALKECDYYTSRYAQCASGRTLSVVWQCRKQAKELNDCLHQLESIFLVHEFPICGIKDNVCSFTPTSGEAVSRTLALDFQSQGRCTKAQWLTLT